MTIRAIVSYLIRYTKTGYIGECYASIRIFMLKNFKFSAQRRKKTRDFQKKLIFQI